MTTQDEILKTAKPGSVQFIRPQKGESLESFQHTVSTVQYMAEEGLLVIAEEYLETQSGHRYIDAIKIFWPDA